MEGQSNLDSLFDSLIADFQERDPPRITPRDLTLPGLPGKADVVTGMRRSGKTFFLYQQIAERLASGVDRDPLLYLNFEDERLLPADTGHLLETAVYLELRRRGRRTRGPHRPRMALDSGARCSLTHPALAATRSNPKPRSGPARAVGSPGRLLHEPDGSVPSLPLTTKARSKP